MHGFLIIDKPAGITSHDIVRKIRRKLGIRRVGHGGTLDPMATGIVPVAVGDATRLLEFFSDSDKGYSATMRLGVTTDSQDAEGEVIATADWQGLRLQDVESAICEMSGDILQVPPMFSALKRNGVPLYKLARQGVEVERKARPVTIRSIAMTGCALPEVSFDVVCSKGTYVRTLAFDIGQKLGCGAHLTALRRFQHGPYQLSNAVSLEAFEAAEDAEAAAMLIPLIDVMGELPLVKLNKDAVTRLLNGVPPQQGETELNVGCCEGDMVRLTDGERLLAIAAFAPSQEKEKRGDFELLRVFVLGQ
jgi:tRNA pseudouridine55 synthase